MSARLGLVTQKGLGANLADIFERSGLKWPLFGIILLALFLGNCAYEAGNLSGAALGLQTVFGDSAYVFKVSVVLIAGLAAALLWRGNYKLIEKLLLGLVMLMAASFIVTFFLVKPDMSAFFKGLLIPQIPDGSLMILIALIGTTIIPYNLFLHAAAVKDRWSSAQDLPAARSDTVVAIGIGGLITILIASTAASFALTTGLEIKNAGDMARQFEPLYGSFSTYVLGVGFFAAGLSSGIAAPLATSYAVTEILRLKGGTTSRPFKLISLTVILCGTSIALTGVKPIEIILTAQFANGLLLPIIAAFLLFAMNQKKLLGRYANSPLANAVGIAIVFIMIGLGARLILRSIGVL